MTLTSGNRQSASSPYWGSEKIINQHPPSGQSKAPCTSGFMVRENASQLMMATAAHCSPPVPPQTTWWLSGSNAFVGSNVFDEWPNEDVMALGTGAPYEYERKIWTGPNLSKWVTERWPAINFNNWGTKNACHLGYRQGAAKCSNWVTGPHTTTVNSTMRGQSTFWLCRAHSCTTTMGLPGDSGAGVYVSRSSTSVAIVGLLNSVGSKSQSVPACTLLRWFSFTPLGQVESSMGVIAETSLQAGSTW